MPELFDRLPAGIFGPLATPHAARYLRVLTRLYRDFFGSDWDDDYEGGLRRTEITGAIKGYLLADQWPTLSGEPPETPLETRAGDIFESLRRSGWLAVEERDVRTLVSMPQMVQHFLGLLIDFAEREKIFIAGKVQVIYSQLRDVLAEPEKQAAGFNEAANQADALVRMLAATRMRAREFSEKLKEVAGDNAAHAEAYFNQFLAELYIGDYHDLLTNNHPLRFRHEIINMATQLHDDEKKRSALERWYARNLANPTASLNRDFERFFQFSSIDRHIEGLDLTFHRVNSQAYNYYLHASRSRGRIEELIDDVIRAVAAGADSVPGMPQVVPLPFAVWRLKLDETHIERRRQPLADTRPTPQMLAEHELGRRMKRNREVTPDGLKQYVLRHIAHAGVFYSEDFEIASIPDYCAYVTLARLASGANTGADQRLAAMLPFEITSVAGELCTNAFVTTRRFVVELHALERKLSEA